MMTEQDRIYFSIAIILYIISMIIIIIKYAVDDADDKERLVAAIGIATALSLAWGLVVIVGTPWLIAKQDSFAAEEFRTESEEKFYMVHRHDANRAGLHFDLRLEDDGSLKSWAIPKGMPTSGRHLAIQTPDHSMEYGRWEGTIKSGYGAGDVKIDTSGTYETIDKSSNNWKFKILTGKYKGVWRLTHWKEDKWLISKSRGED